MVLRTVLLWFVKSYLRILEILLNQYIASDRKTIFTTLIDQSLHKGDFSICRYIFSHFLNALKYVSLTSWVQVIPWYFRRLLRNALFPWFLFKSSCYLYRQGSLIVLSLFYIPLILVKVFSSCTCSLVDLLESFVCKITAPGDSYFDCIPSLCHQLTSCSHIMAITNSSRTIMNWYGGSEHLCIFSLV